MFGFSNVNMIQLQRENTMKQATISIDLDKYKTNFNNMKDFEEIGDLDKHKTKYSILKQRIINVDDYIN